MIVSDSVELKDLVGLHQLTGVDMDNELTKEHYGWEEFMHCQVINFMLDGITYTVSENPEDGYRSSMREILVSNKPIKNKFEPVQVNGVMRPNTRGYSNDIVDFYDVKTGKVVLSVGTEDLDDWYPNFVGYFDPTAMAINA